MNMLKFCWKYIRKVRGMFFFYFSLNILSSAISMITPLISGALVTNLTGPKDEQTLFFYCGLFIAVTLGNMGIGFIISYLYIHIQTKAGYVLNVDIIKHIQQLSLSYFTKMDTAYLSNRVNTDSNSILIFCISSIISVFCNGASLLISTIILFSVHMPLTILLFCLLLLYIFLYKLFKKALYDKNLQVKEVQSVFFSDLLKQLTQIRFIKTHAIATSFLVKLDKSFQRLFHILLSSQKLNFLFSSADTLVRMFAQAGIFILGGMAVIKGNISIGLFTVIISYFNVMLGAGQYFFNLGSSYQNNLVSFDRIQSILKEPVQQEGKRKLSTITSIKMQNLSFQYDNAYIFQDYHLQLESGKIYGLTGANGAGKSTLIYLLLGLYQDEYEGKILYNDYEIHELNMTELRRKQIGVTEQEPVLLPDTFYKNLFLEQVPNVEQMQLLANILNIQEYLSNLPNGLDTTINEKSSNLSGGEKQKISILRQFLKNPDLMIFDEPTSALDVASREAFFHHLTQIKQDKIIIVISHTTEMNQICDEFIYLDKENIREHKGSC